MIYEKYFSKDMINEPYENPDEQLYEAMSFLDMLLENRLKQRGGLVQDPPLYSRGLAVTHEELVKYLEAKEQERTASGQDDGFAEEAERAFAHIRAREDMSTDISLPLLSLRTVFSMTDLEYMALLLALAIHYDVRYERMYAYLQDDMALKNPTAGLLYALYSQWQPVSVEEVLRLFDSSRNFALLWEEDTQASASRLQMRLRLKKSVLQFMYHDTDMEGEPSVFSNFDREDSEGIFFLGEDMDRLKRLYLLQESVGQPGTVLYLYGREGAGKRTIVGSLCRDAGRKLIHVNLKLMMSCTGDVLEKRIRDILLDSVLTDAKICLYAEDIVDEEEIRRAQIVIKKLFMIHSLLFVTGREKHFRVLDGAEYVNRIEVGNYSMPLRRRMWSELCADYPFEDGFSSDDIAWQYDLSVGNIRKVLESAMAATAMSGKNDMGRQEVVNAILNEQHLDFQGLATRIRVVYDWDDIQLLDKQKEIIKLACSRYRLKNRLKEEWGLGARNAYGNGLSILLYGPPGTGKTMVTHIFARELGMELYRVDLSQISSKYVGETEKNLKMIFDEANRMNLILFFDEADSLFSKRTGVNSSNDKYANAETAYILQKIEEYDGVTILATNLFNNFDAAFMRRITYSVWFENPDTELRYKLWTTILPKDIPIDSSINFRFFAERFELSGSTIKSILYSAAYMAGMENKDLSAQHIIKAIRFEYQKLGKLVNNEDFSDYRACSM